jgi:hypothetical protein
MEFGPFPKENSLLLGEVTFFIMEFLFTPWGTCLGLTLSLFSPGEVTPQGKLTFKDYLNVLWIFSSISFVGKTIEKRIEP